ncbi:GNAT superfamily N-acetyltransferase [Symbiobacterium terraclitae]|uniref:GNAT superfamily N-acetyltransferase n=1 Tax=Symbiobacterium terraclitae TaxID=557451 RepID=A0ABS4JTZ0_9FIRM|nr:GNAT family N-acetyltransferase [Symbiobacterium terraclitae]MBP2018997.1 GNAT superfamily N-acetyltransferase [Symbiobacterium terraclitae]
MELWKGFPFDDPVGAERHSSYMTAFYENVYARKGDLFFHKCLFVCDAADRPVATCFAWKAYDRVTTIHWLKVRKEYEGMGIGRALLSVVMQGLQPDDFPVFLHTQPGSYRAIKLYTDFGFHLLSDPVIGTRRNDLEQCLPILKPYMPEEAYQALRVTQAPAWFPEAVRSSDVVEF